MLHLFIYVYSTCMSVNVFYESLLLPLSFMIATLEGEKQEEEKDKEREESKILVAAFSLPLALHVSLHRPPLLFWPPGGRKSRGHFPRFIGTFEATKSLQKAVVASIKGRKSTDFRGRKRMLTRTRPRSSLTASVFWREKKESR